MSEAVVQGIVLFLYLFAMVMIGFLFYKKDSTQDDYILGGRDMNMWVTSMSAQASDMSGWLLMGLPGTAYLLGSGATEAAWTAPCLRGTGGCARRWAGRNPQSPRPARRRP